MVYTMKCENGHVHDYVLSVKWRNGPVACVVCGSPARREFAEELKSKRLVVPEGFHITHFKTKEEEEGTYGGRWV